jgi:hypothetical protein
VVSIEKREYEWVVMANGELMSIHPTRGEAERAALWLTRELPVEPEVKLRQRTITYHIT